MPIYRLGDLVPDIHPEAYVHPDAVVIGDVVLGSESTVWPGAVLRGDFGRIVVGARSSVQDGTVIHAGPRFPTVVGDGCVIGHLAHLEGCTLEDGSLVGSGSVVLHFAVVRDRCDGRGQRRRAEPHGGPGRGTGPRGAGPDPAGKSDPS